MARRGENIRKRSDGRWEGRYIKGRSADGKPCWGYVYGATYAEVREISIRKKAEYGIYNLNGTDITFKEISEQWLYSVRQSVKESTFSHYQYTLRHYLLPVFGCFKASTLDEKTLEQGLLEVITPTSGMQKPLGTTMAQECLSMLRRICKYAAHLHLIRPLEITVKLPQKTPKVLLPFTTEEQKKLQTFVMESPTSRKYIYDNVLKNHETLPLGEFAIGTNTTAYVVARKYGIEDKMPILIAEKTGPHFAVGDTCYSHCEETEVHNPDGKEIVAKYNECSKEGEYFQCHTDITIPYEELDSICAITLGGDEILLIKDGKFVLSGTETLNEPLTEIG